MLTRYYGSARVPMSDLFDALRFFDGTESLSQRTDQIDDSGIKIEMPGVKTQDLDVSVEGKTLKVSGKSRHGKSFNYTYSLKSNVDVSSITAKLQDGLLDIALPKKAEESARKITVT